MSLPLDIVGQIGGPTNAVDVGPPYAYVGVGLRLVVVDIADPSHPQVRGETQALPGIVHDVQVAGNLAYVADEAGGLRVIDVSNPAAPQKLGFARTPEGAKCVQVVGDLAYVADADDGLINRAGQVNHGLSGRRLWSARRFVRQVVWLPPSNHNRRIDYSSAGGLPSSRLAINISSTACFSSGTFC